MKIVVIVGTRPEAIKMAPVIKRLSATPSVNLKVVFTGQHREMVNQIFDFFQITPDYSLDVMTADQKPLRVMTEIMIKLEEIIVDFLPDWVLVQGDTTTALAGALVAAYQGIKVGHVEAGLRTYDIKNPFPEEINRVLIDHISDLAFAPTQKSKDALLREGISEDKIYITGNTVVDALKFITKKPTSNKTPISWDGKHQILVTVHRRENHGSPLIGIFNALKKIAARKDVHIIYPVHPNPNVRIPAYKILEKISNITLLDPLDYLTFINVMKNSYFILTDSGGIQEEASYFGIPVLILRSCTERQEVVEAGVAKIVGTTTKNIVSECYIMLDNHNEYKKMSKLVKVFGVGTSSKQIVDILLKTRG